MESILISKQDLIGAIESCPFDVTGVRMNYSGRFMYGRTCLGIVGDPSDLVLFVQHVVPGIPELEDVDLSSDLRSDNMGLKMIYYWPDIRVIDDSEALKENDE